MKLKFHLSYIALVLLVLGYIFSAGRFFLISADGKNKAGEGEAADSGVIRVAHWQLEPGFREGMQWAIDEYNRLPHVEASGIRVEQTPITEKVYNQFMNVHLISGTAPDIAAKGMTRLIQGNAVAKFYAPLGVYVNKPNPYNAPQNLDGGLPSSLRNFLAEAAWKDTFTDGMAAGYDANLDDYYAVPAASWGTVRFYYNMNLVRETKRFIEAALVEDPQGEWLRNIWLRETEAGERGFLPETEALREWLESDRTPDTLGQLFLLAEAVLVMAEVRNLKFLVPISGSSYEVSDISTRYRPVFYSHFHEALDKNPASAAVDPLEALAGRAAGVWDFDSEPIAAFYDFARYLVRFYPKGYLGLDREQAQRRFVQGNAMLISSGGWDASGILIGTEGKFEVRIAPPPYPVEGERWDRFLPGPPANASASTGVPLAINKSSPHFDQALDFLRFITSQPINEEMTRRAKWLPSVVGAEPVESLKPFSPILEGIPPSWAIRLEQTTGGFKTRFTAASANLVTGEISLEGFVSELDAFLDNPGIGLSNIWFREWQGAADGARATDRALSVEDFEAFFNGSQAAEQRLNSLFFDSLAKDEGVSVRLLWNKYHPDTPFPTN